MDPLPRYRAKQVVVNRRRCYEIEGQRYPGVTTVLSATKPPEDRAALAQWRQRVGAAEAQRIAGTASSVGTRLHKQLAAYLQGERPTLPPDVQPYWDSMVPILDQVDQVLLVEGAVWHSDGFVGFPDALVRYDGDLCLCDWKTARKPKQLAWIGDYCLQVAAYWRAAEQVYAPQGLEIRRGLVAIALADAPAQTFWIPLNELADYWAAFQQRLTTYQSRQRWGLL
jgi:predicted RecB family nuclease